MSILVLVTCIYHEIHSNSRFHKTFSPVYFHGKKKDSPIQTPLFKSEISKGSPRLDAMPNLITVPRKEPDLPKEQRQGRGSTAAVQSLLCQVRTGDHHSGHCHVVKRKILN